MQKFAICTLLLSSVTVLLAPNVSVAKFAVLLAPLAMTLPFQFVAAAQLPEAAPVVVWEGSHTIMRRAFAAALAGHAEADWPEVDVTDAYHAARREVFDTCRRVTIPARPGEAYVIHRLALHGVAPWAEGAGAEAEGRAIAYFRPELPGGIGDWLAAP